MKLVYRVNTNSSTVPHKVSPIITLPIVFIFIGVFFAVTGLIFNGIESRTRSKCDLQTEAVVVELLEKQGEHSTVYAPVFEFVTADGQRILLSSNIYSRPPMYDVGETVTVAYSSADPETMYVKNSLGMYLFAYIFGGIGAIILLVGIIILFALIKIAGSSSGKQTT